MAEKSYPIVWTKRSQLQMSNIYDYISKDSLQNAIKVFDDITAVVDKAAANPEIYSMDKNKINNDGSYRAIEKHHYRISYRFTKKDIRILRVRHTSMRPLMY